MTVPFENDTGNIVRKLARKSLKSEKRRNLMVVIAVALASCLICFSIVMALSTRQIEKNHVEDTYEAVYTRITEEDVSTLKGLDDFSRVGEYYMLAVEPAEQGYNASYIYCDEETMYIARDQMKLLEGRLPQKEDEVVVSRYFLSNYGADAGIGEKVMLSSESFHGEYTVTGIMEGYKEKEVNGSSILLSKEALKGWSGYDPADYRAYVHFKNEQQMDETELTARSREIAKEYQLEMPIMNLSYMKFYKQPVNVSMLALGAEWFWVMDDDVAIIVVAASLNHVVPIGPLGQALDAFRHDGDVVDFDFPMPVHMVAANPLVREDAGKVAFVRGPLAYCAEGVDNGANLHLLHADTARIASDPSCVSVDRIVFHAGAAAQDEQGLGEVDAVDMPMTTLTIPAWREVEDSAQTSALYHDWRPAERKTTTATLIPYFAWANRGENEMTVFLRG